MASWDVIVIGSGAGGAPVAERLAAAGMNVLVLERGKRFTKAQFEDRDEIEWCRRDRFVPSILTDPHTRRADEAAKAMPTTDGWISSILGGGTIHMSGFFLRARPEDTKLGSRLKEQGTTGHSAVDWAVPFDDIARYYPTVEDEMGVSGIAGGKLAPLAEHPMANRAEATAKKLGLPIERTPRAILTAARPDDDRAACAYRLVCASYGCPNDARGSMLVTYLRRGEKSGKVTVWTEALVTKLEKAGPDRVSGVRVKRLDNGGVEETVTAGVVVLACGAIESARLLLLSGEGFNPGGNVGKNLWFSLYVDVNAWFPKATMPEVMTGSPFIHRSLMVGGALKADEQKTLGLDRAGMLDLLWQHDNPIHRAERLAIEGGGTLWGRALKERIKQHFTEGRSMLCEGFGESIPHAGAYVDLDPATKDQHGLPVARLTYAHHPRDRKVAEHLAKTGLAILKDMGGQNAFVRVGIGETLILQGGTTRFGDEAKDSVTSPAGLVHGLKNLYVTDGGVLPSSMTAPGTLTIVANALRVAAGIVKQAGAARP
ncbi:MAG: GMC family oxidoreductase [Deltaproteobacteria bacterium]|nr:GMC family oxidoreductase [Deltaproteobacteria bacterium]